MKIRVPTAVLGAALVAAGLCLPAQEPSAGAQKAETSAPAKAPKTSTGSKAAPKVKMDPKAKSLRGGPDPRAPLTPVPSSKVPLPSRKKAPKIPYEKRVNLNSASREELMKVPTVDGATADKIIANRPYKTTADLLMKGVVPGAHFYTVKDLVTAGPMPGQPWGTPPVKK